MTENTNASVNDYALQLAKMTKRSPHISNLFFKAIAVCLVFMLSSCEDSTSLDSNSLITAVGETTTRSNSKESESIVNNCPVVFTGNDIQWFNPKTREIKFKKNIDHTSFRAYQKIHFSLKDSPLFTAYTYASQYHSFGIKDLVLFIDLSTGKCYLHDCYPLEVLEYDPDTKKNKENRAESWDKFIDQLNIEKRLK